MISSYSDYVFRVGIGLSAEQSSTFSFNEAKKALDGVIQYMRYGGSRTNKEVVPWWRVNLGKKTFIGRVDVLLVLNHTGKLVETSSS